MRTRDYHQRAPTSFESLDVFGYALRGNNLGTALLIWLLVSFISIILSAHLSFAAAPLAYLTALVTIQYSFVIIEQTSRGHRDVPRLSADLFTPTQDSRMFSLFVVTTVFLAMFLLLRVWTPVAGYLLLLLVFPASLAVLTIDRQLLKSLNPIAWYHILSNIRLDHLVLQFLLLQGLLFLSLYFAASFFLNVEEINLPGWLVHEFFLFTTVACLLTYYRLLGVLLHANGDALGIPPLISEDTQQREVDAAAARDRAVFIQSIYNIANSNRLKLAWQTLQAKMQEENYIHEGEYFGSICLWDKPSLTAKAAQAYLERLVKADDLRVALNVFDIGAAAHEDFVVLSGDTLLTIAAKADTAERKKNLLPLLANFPEEYPKHLRKGSALLLASAMAADLLDFDTARGLLQRLEHDYPETTRQQKYLVLKELLNES
jgi:hypothetical protein